jgi:hypothetical protein
MSKDRLTVSLNVLIPSQAPTPVPLRGRGVTPQPQPLPRGRETGLLKPPAGFSLPSAHFDDAPLAQPANQTLVKRLKSYVAVAAFSLSPPVRNARSTAAVKSWFIRSSSSAV